MANVSRPNGFIPVKHLNGSPYNGQVNTYEIPAGEAAPVMIGDLVKQSDNDSTDIYPAVERYAASGEVTSGLIVGAVVGFLIDPTNLNTPQYRAASTKRFVLVADSPDIIFEVQDGATVPTPLASIGLNTGVQCTVGSTTTGVSNMTTGATAATTTNSLPLNIVGVSSKVGNETAVASQKLLVRINQHQFMGGQTAA